MPDMKLCTIQVDDQLLEQQAHGTPAFPLQMYLDDLENYDMKHVPWHWHPEIEFGVMLSGRVRLHTGDAHYELGPGMGFFVNSGALHMVEPLERDSMFFSIVLHPSLLYGQPQSAVAQKYVHPLLENGSLKGLLLEDATPWQQRVIQHLWGIRALCESAAQGHELAVHATLSEMWREIYLACEEQYARGPAQGNRDDARLKEMLGYIHLHYAQSLTLAGIAAAANVSVSECCRCFKRTLSVTPFAYLNSYRLGEAAKQLAAGCGVTEAAALCGFASPSYFGKLFLAQFGCTPRQYRQRAIFP